MVFGTYDNVEDPKEGLNIDEFTQFLTGSEDDYGLGLTITESDKGAVERLFCEIDINGNGIISEYDLFNAISEFQNNDFGEFIPDADDE